MANKLISVFLVMAAFLSAEARGVVPNRLSAKIVDLGKVYPIRMVPGLATIIETPVAVTDAIPGDSKTVKFLPVGNSQNEVRLVLAHGSAYPTNLIIRAGGKKYVFDIIPSRDTHQDIVQIMSSYGGPELQDAELELIATTTKGGVKK
jgi:hypothetical protein